ncbi:MAG: PstS family phosphate ABC transporter substrate-binding protein [Cyanobacteria bacterium P01_G01_bin.38]
MKNLKKNLKNNVFPLVIGLGAMALIGGTFSLLWWWATRVDVPSSSPTSAKIEATASAAPAALAEPVISLKPIESVPDGLYNYGGSTTMLPIRNILEPAIQETFPGFKLRYANPAGKSPGSGTGIDMLLEGQLSFSESSRPIKLTEHEAAQQRGFSLDQIPIAIDGIAIAVNPELELAGLTLEQLRDIYLGRITNWAEVDGPDLTIRPLSRSAAAGGTPEFFSENVLDGTAFDSRVDIVETTTQGLREVATSPGSIYYASAPEVVPQCLVKTVPLATDQDTPLIAPYQPPFAALENCPEQRNQLNKQAFREGTYPLTRRLFVIVKKDASVDEAAGQAYSDILLTAEGQALIEQAGFVSIR